MPNKIRIASLLIFIGLVSLYFIGFRGTKDISLEEAKMPVTLSVGEGSKKAKYVSLQDRDSEARIEKTSVEDAVQNNTEIVEAILLESAQEIISWQNDRGYIFADERSGNPIAIDYDSYDDEALKSLADGGDKRASLLLGQKLMMAKDQDKRSEAAKYLFEASAHGYSASLIDLGSLSVLEHIFAKNSGKFNDAREHAVNAKAWYEVAILRGDPLAKNPLKNFNYEYTKDDESAVLDRAERFFNQLKARRDDLGLPPFNNEYPPALEFIAN